MHKPSQSNIPSGQIQMKIQRIQVGNNFPAQSFCNISLKQYIHMWWYVCETIISVFQLLFVGVADKFTSHIQKK